MAIVLVIVGLILNLGIATVSSVTENRKMVETKQALDAIEDALVVFAVSNEANNRLPCPAAGNIQPGAANYGVEQRAGTCTITDGRAIVPWITLGLDERYSRDGWGRRISYIPSAALVADAALRRGTAPIYPVANIQVLSASAGGTTLTSAAAYVLISHGRNGAGGYSVAGTLVAGAGLTSANETQNSDGQSPFVQRDSNSTAANYFDDIFRWRSSGLMIQACGTGFCGN
ncbi:MAG: hypothetical protein K2Q10_04865 [Rhodospirillales bacterium]|nr:hypothetical protein [Rhodospirillales bacterium]